MTILRRGLTEIHAPRTTGILGELTIETPTWMAAALCAQTDPELFFPEKGGSTREAKSLCLTCDVRSECLNHALTNQERFGIWGGLSERERRQLHRRQREGGTAS